MWASICTLVLAPKIWACLIATACLIICLHHATINFEGANFLFVYHCISSV